MKYYIQVALTGLKMLWYDLFDIPKAALVLLIDKEGKILSVSRKDNPNDKNIAGGKVDDGETFTQAAKRELFEETGLIGYNLVPIFFRKDGIYKCVVFLADYKGEISVKEKGVVEWVKYNVILEGSFQEYNTELKKVLDKVGVYVS